MPSGSPAGRPQEIFPGVVYDPAADAFIATSGRELEPMFTEIFKDAPDGRDNVVAYLTKWDEILKTVYPDLHRHGAGPKSQAFIMQMTVAAYENAPVDAEFKKVAEVLGINEDRVIVSDGVAPIVNGTSGKDYFYVSTGSQTYRGGLGEDLYVVGRNFGNATIEDVEGILQGHSPDTLRFAHLRPQDIIATKDGIDLVFTVIGSNDVLTIKNQFDGKFPGIFGGDYSPSTEMVEIVFADGTVWDAVDIAYATSRPTDDIDLVLGTPSIAFSPGGKAKTLRGGAIRTLHLGLGYGHDRIEEGDDTSVPRHVDIASPRKVTEEISASPRGFVERPRITVVDIRRGDGDAPHHRRPVPDDQRADRPIAANRIEAALFSDSPS